jgi:hypothetical protein
MVDIGGLPSREQVRVTVKDSEVVRGCVGLFDG